MEQGGPCVRACDSVWQHERPWSGTLKSQSRLCGVARERHESLVHNCVGVGAFVELKMLFWPKTLNRKHGPLFFSSAAFVCVCFFFFRAQKGAHLMLLKSLFCSRVRSVSSTWRSVRMHQTFKSFGEKQDKHVNSGGVRWPSTLRWPQPLLLCRSLPARRRPVTANWTPHRACSPESTQ